MLRAQSVYDGLVQSGSGVESIESRHPPLSGFTRVVVEDGSYADWLRGLPLLPKSTPATDWQSRHVFAPEDVGGVLDWRLLGEEEQCADIALRLRAEFAQAQTPGASPWFRSLSGQQIHWSRWLRGEYGTNRDASAITYREGASKADSRAEFDRFLSFVMNYTNTKSMSRDWQVIAESELQIGDVVIQPHCTGAGMGHLSVVVDAIADEEGQRRYIFVDGYTPARVPVVRQLTVNNPESVWMTPSDYLELQKQFGPGVFHRFPGW